MGPSGATSSRAAPAIRRVLGLIPAPGGSISVLRQHVRLLAGRPLIAHSIEAALASRSIDRVIVSTDDEEIAETARRHGAEVPFLRPPRLAEPGTPDMAVLRHALEWLDQHEGWQPEIIVQLRPTRPLRRPEDIDLAVEMLDARPEADAVRSVAEPLEHPYQMWSATPDGWLAPIVRSELAEPFDLPRERLPVAYWQTGAVDAVRRRTVIDTGSTTGARILPLVVDPLGAVAIDSEASLDRVEWMIRSGRVPWMAPLPAAALAPSGRRPSGRPKLLVFDFDGVMTDNRVWVNEHGEEMSVFDRGDGMGIRLLREAGVDVVVLSTEANPIVAARCRKLAIPCVQGVLDKPPALLQWVSEHGVDLADVAYVGNDINDLGCLQIVGLAVAVADSHPEVLEAAHLTLTRPGGSGAVREICDLIRTSPHQ